MMDIPQEADTQIFLAAEDDHAREKIHALPAKSKPKSIERLVDRRPSVVDPIVAHARHNGYAAVMDASAWAVDQVPAPDVTDKETVLTMAYIAADAYVETDDRADWLDVGEPFNKTADFGWHGDGLRGHIWADEDNSTVVIGLKGTSVAVFDGDGTTTNDKVNDNLFFSCCCGQQGQWTYHQVCDCASGTYSCNNTCVRQALREENRYYTASRELYSNVTERYPNSNIWIVGHSLGGAVSAMLGLTYGLPVVTFEAVPDALAASRLGLPAPPGSDPQAPQTRDQTGIYHFGHTADPIYIGTCNGATASCTYAGYALETTCHSGQECVYDVVNDKGWRVGIGTHKIRSVIADVLKKYDDVPKCEYTPECRDCAQWKMFESNGTERTTTSTSSTTTRTRTRTSTCKTPGWWGCLDQTTMESTTVTTTTTSTSSTSTCKTPGWFGCNDKTTTTTPVSTTMMTTTMTTTTDSTTPAPTTSCETPGWFGCKDKTASSATTTSQSTTPSSTCETPGRFWGCWDTAKDGEPTSLATDAVTRPTITANPTPTQTAPATPVSLPPDRPSRCLRRNWIGFCKEWDEEKEINFASEEN